MADRRWSCPHDEQHPGAIAPERMRRDDIRRFCLVCSVKTGRLVHRVCAVAEARREAKQESKAARNARKRAARKLALARERAKEGKGSPAVVAELLKAAQERLG